MRARLNMLLCFVAGLSVSLNCTATDWHSYLSYYQIIAVARSEQKIFAANENGLFSYHLSDKNFATFSRVEGLSDKGISAISWSASKDGILIGYTNGNIDLLIGNTILNLPDIKLKTSIAKRSINNILCEGDYAWLSCDFGIVKINLKRWEVAETWLIGTEASSISVRELATDEKYFWAATETGVFRAEKTNPNLQDYHNWTIQNQLPVLQKYFVSIASYNKMIYTCDSDGKSYSFDGTSWQTVFPQITGVRKIKPFSSALALICDKQIEIITANTTTISTYTNLTQQSAGIYPKDALISATGDLWIGDHTFGLIYRTGNGLFTSLVPSSPADNSSTKLTISGTNLYVATATDDTESASVPAEIHRLQELHWFSLNEFTVPVLSGFKNITSVVSSSGNPDHFWASTREGGFLEFDGSKMVKNYNSNNSTLEAFKGGCRIGGLKVDVSGNLWITNPSVKHQLHVLKTDGVLKSLSYPGIDNQFVSAGEVVITKTDTKWIIVNNSDLFALRTGKTPDNMSDDLYRKTSVRSRFSNSETTIIKGFNELNALAEDHNGYLWAGTESGVVLYSNPEALFGDTDFYGVQPSVDLGDGLFHPLLENLKITAIAVDGGNRKWFGTNNSGVFLYSEDGSKLIEHFNTENSPLFSDHINSIAINGLTGEVFFATDRGLISRRGDATEGGNSFQNLYVWPNPVRETYQGDVTIDGLTAESTVKITDVNGSLVFKTTSNGGRATWNGKLRNGQRANTGVYLIFCSNNDGSRSRVIKLLFIH